jgi:hypothetical protein
MLNHMWHVIKTYASLFLGHFSIHLLFVLGALRNGNPHSSIPQCHTGDKMYNSLGL